MSFLDKLKNKLQVLEPFFYGISQNKYFKTISAGMIGLLPLTIVGSLASLISSIQIESWQNILQSTGIGAILQIPINFTTNLLALYVVFLIAKALVEQFGYEKDSTMAGIVALLCFFMLTPTTEIGEGFAKQIMLPFEWIGSKGIFSAIIIALVVGRLYVAIIKRKWIIKMPAGVPPMISKSFESLIPATIIGTLFVIITAIFRATPYGSIHNMIYHYIQIPIQGVGGSIWSLMAVGIFAQLLWFFGIHGASIVIALIKPILLPLDMQNLAAYAAGEALPNLTGMSFYLVFTRTSMVLGLIILMLFAKSKRYKTLGKLGIVPALFGITEPVIFGTPLVMNFRFFLPFVFSQSIAMGIAYFCMVIGIIPPCNGATVVLGMPIFLVAFIQGSWKIMAIQIMCFAITTLFWMPGFKKADKEACEEEKQELELTV